MFLLVAQYPWKALPRAVQSVLDSSRADYPEPGRNPLVHRFADSPKITGTTSFFMVWVHNSSLMDSSPLTDGVGIENFHKGPITQ